MLSDETFPSDLLSDGEECLEQSAKIVSTKIKIGSTHSMDDVNLSISTTDDEKSNDSTEIEEQSMMENSLETERLLKSSEFSGKLDESENTPQEQQQMKNTFPEASFQSASSLKINNILPPPRAPIKKKKSFSCHNLNNMKRTNGHTNNYDHVESKVKKLIENLTEDRRKTLLRHKSMPVCGAQATANDIGSQEQYKEKDQNEMKRELRRKSIKIYELEEKIELKDNQIYDLQLEKSKMKMIFDKLRVELQELKEMERKYKQLKSQCSPNKSQRNAIIQTDDSGLDSMEYSKVNILRESVVIQHHDTNYAHINPVIRQLAFESSNQSHFSDINNTSSDNLIPENLEQIDLDENAICAVEHYDEKQHDESNAEKLKSKKKKKLKFFSFVPCVSRK